MTAVVDNQDDGALGDQPAYRVHADETRATGHQDALRSLHQ